MEIPTVVVAQSLALYCYCLFLGRPRDVSTPGIDESVSTFALAYRDLCALVSYVPRALYTSAALEERLREPSWLAMQATQHDTIVQRVMKHHAVLPCTFGTTMSDVAQVMGLLERHYDGFHAFLSRIQDQEEWGVKVYAAAPPTALVTPASDLVHELDQRLATASPGEAYLLHKKRSALIRQHADQYHDALATRIYQQIRTWCPDGCTNRPLSSRVTGRADTMILNAAFLVTKSDVAAFQCGVEALAARYAHDKMSFALSGPWPPYNFCPDAALQG